jgi:hypothetical protein
MDGKTTIDVERTDVSALDGRGMDPPERVKLVAADGQTEYLWPPLSPRVSIPRGAIP